MKLLIVPALAFSFLTGCSTSLCHKSTAETGTTGHIVTEATARQAALAKVPGTVQKSEMESWKGKRYYTFDIATKSAKKPVEVAVDPATGKVVWSSNEKER